MTKNKILMSVVLVYLSFALFPGCKSHTKVAVSENSTPSKEQVIERGRYLVASIGCSDCHSPKKITPEGPVVIQTLMFSGFPADGKLPKFDKTILEQGWTLSNNDFTANVGSFGVSYGANITTDSSGIGNWPEANFIRAMKKGKFKGVEGARTLLPPMPWEDFQNLKDDDVKAIYAFLITTNPVHNVVPMTMSLEDIK
jgi:hypothetical protein